jgi:hypothetical protein
MLNPAKRVLTLALVFLMLSRHAVSFLQSPFS